MSAKLIFFCGKMAAGKSTLARELAAREKAVLLVEDHFLATLFPGEITDIPQYVERSTRIKDALTPVVCELLAHGVSVVLDFPANTVTQRAWFRELIERTGLAHELHLIEASDELCKAQLRNRSKALPDGARWTSEAEFDAITKYFQPPAEGEKFNVVRHKRT